MSADSVAAEAAALGLPITVDGFDADIDELVTSAELRGTTMTREQAREIVLGGLRRLVDTTRARNAGSTWVSALDLPRPTTRHGTLGGGRLVTELLATRPAGLSAADALAALDAACRSGSVILIGTGPEARLARR